MRRILAIFKRDIAHVRHNAIALLVIMGLAVIPSLYAWFNIAGGWDPYGNTGQVKVALANSDRGVTGTLLPFKINVGERVVSQLSGSDKIGYVVTTEDKAREGVRSGEYYAAVVIPKDFSANLMSVVSNNPTHPELEYYVNEKSNAIASIVTDKASGSVQNLVEKGATSAVGDAVTSLFNELSAALDSDGVMSVAADLRDAIDDSQLGLERSAIDIDAYKEAVASVRDVIQTSSTMLGDHSATLDAADALTQAATGVRQFDEAVQTAKNAASEAIDGSAEQVQGVQNAIDSAFATAEDKADQLSAALDKVEADTNSRMEQLQSIYDKLSELNGTIVDLNRELENDGKLADASLEASLTVKTNISDLLARTKNALDRANDLIATVRQARSDLSTARENLKSGKEEVEAMAAQAATDVSSMRDEVQSTVAGSLDGVASTLDDASAKATEISDSIHAETDEIGPLMSKATDGLASLEYALGNASTKLRDTASKLQSTSDSLAGAVSSGNVELARNILSGDATTLVDFLASPVQLDREAIYPVENAGSAMTPYYTTMALWVGGTLMGILLYAGISKRAEEETGARPSHAYFGRLLFFLMIGFVQSSVLLLGDVFFLGVQCKQPLLFLVAGWVASTVFINIIYALATSFGDVGKAIAVFIMVVQVAGSGGTFPVQMLPEPFQMVYPLLPFVHSENAMRAAMFGLYGNDWLIEVGILAAYLVPALILGLLLRKPFVPVNEWIEEKMEETKLM